MMALAFISPYWKDKMTNNTQHGNALFFILIAIALLGLLTMTMTRSSSDSNDTGGFEQSQIVASEVLNYAKSIENALQMLIARGCSENELSFWHDSNGDGSENASDNYYNSKSPTDHSCHVFDVAGAGLTYLDMTEKIGPSINFRIGVTSVDRALKDIGEDDQADLYFSYITNLRDMDGFCDAINRMSGVQKTGSAPVGSYDPYTTLPSAMSDSFFTGTFNKVNTVQAPLNEILGKRIFCVGHNSGLNFMYVLLAR